MDPLNMSFDKIVLKCICMLYVSLLLYMIMLLLRVCLYMCLYFVFVFSHISCHGPGRMYNVSCLFYMTFLWYKRNAWLQQSGIHWIQYAVKKVNCKYCCYNIINKSFSVPSQACMTRLVSWTGRGWTVRWARTSPSPTGLRVNRTTSTATRTAVRSLSWVNSTTGSATGPWCTSVKSGRRVSLIL